MNTVISNEKQRNQNRINHMMYVRMDDTYQLKQVFHVHSQIPRMNTVISNEIQRGTHILIIIKK